MHSENDQVPFMYLRSFIHWWSPDVRNVWFFLFYFFPTKFSPNDVHIPPKLVFFHVHRFTMGNNIFPVVHLRVRNGNYWLLGKSWRRQLALWNTNHINHHMNIMTAFLMLSSVATEATLPYSLTAEENLFWHVDCHTKTVW